MDQGQGRRDAAWCRRSRPLSRSPALYVRADPRLQHVVVTPQICRPGQGSAREPSQRIENFFHCIRVTDDLPGRKSDVRAATMAQRDTSLLPTLLGELHSRVMVAKWRSVLFRLSHDTVCGDGDVSPLADRNPSRYFPYVFTENLMSFSIFTRS